MKDIEIVDLSIFKDDDSLLHAAFSCQKNGVDITKNIFNELSNYAVIKNSQQSNWYDIHPSLYMFYDKNKNTLEFIEKEQNVFNQEYDTSALTLLPSLLLRDWHIINREEKDLLSAAIEAHPLVATT